MTVVAYSNSCSVRIMATTSIPTVPTYTISSTVVNVTYYSSAIPLENPSVPVHIAHIVRSSYRELQPIQVVLSITVPSTTGSECMKLHLDIWPLLHYIH